MLDHIDQNPEKYPDVSLGEIMFSKYKLRKQRAEQSYLQHNAQTEEEKIEAILRDNPEPYECAMVLLDGYANQQEIKKYYRSISHRLPAEVADHVYRTTRYDSPLFYATFIAHLPR